MFNVCICTYICRHTEVRGCLSRVSILFPHACSRDLCQDLRLGSKGLSMLSFLTGPSVCFCWNLHGSVNNGQPDSHSRSVRVPFFHTHQHLLTHFLCRSKDNVVYDQKLWDAASQVLIACADVEQGSSCLRKR